MSQSQPSPSKSGLHIAPNPVPMARHLDPVIFESSASVRALPKRSNMNWPRKIFHMIGIGTTGFVLAFCTLSQLQAWIILAVVSAIIVGVDYGRRFSPKLNEKAFKDFGFIMRDYERHGISGMSWFLFAMLIVLAFCPLPVAGLAALLLAFGDPWASVFGIRFGKTKLFGGKKSLEGLLGGWAVCVVVSAIYLFVTGLVAPAMILPAALLSGLAGALAEAIPANKVDDNFTLPLGAAPALLGIIALLG